MSEPLRFVRVGRGESNCGILMDEARPAFLAIPHEWYPKDNKLNLCVPSADLEVVLDREGRAYVATPWSPRLEERIQELIVLLHALRVAAVAA